MPPKVEAKKAAAPAVKTTKKVAAPVAAAVKSQVQRKPPVPTGGPAAAAAKRGVTFNEAAAAAEKRTVLKPAAPTAGALKAKPAAKAATTAPAKAAAVAKAAGVVRPTGKPAAPAAPAAKQPQSAAAASASPKGKSAAAAASPAKAAKGPASPPKASPTAASEAAPSVKLVSAKQLTGKEKIAAAKLKKRLAADAKKGGAAAVAPYKAMQLRYLPIEFQEPELERFLTQFGEVKSVFCARQRRTHASTGVAYVRMADEDLLPQLVEECNGMLLGGRVVRARRVTLRRPMPSRAIVDERRFEDQKRRFRGVAIARFDVVSAKTSNLGALKKQKETEDKLHTHLKRLGIDYEFRAFAQQLAKAPKSAIKSKAVLKKEQAERKAANNATARQARRRTVAERAKARLAKKSPANESVDDQTAVAAKKVAKKGRGRQVTVVDRDPLHVTDSDDE